MLAGLAAILGPLAGGQLARVTDWRGLFLFLAGAGAVLLLAALVVLRETLPVHRRTGGGVRQTGRDYRRLVADPLFLGAVLITGFLNAALFAYLSGATYVLQGHYGLSPQGYALAFGLNSLGFMVFGHVAGRLAERWSQRGTLVIGIAMCAAGAAGLLATGLLDLPLIAIVVSLLSLVSGVAVTTPPTTSLALQDYPQLAGTASSLLGLARFALGGLAAPLVGVAGADAILPLGVVTAVSVALAVITHRTLLRGPATAPLPQPARDQALSPEGTVESGVERLADVKAGPVAVEVLDRPGPEPSLIPSVQPIPHPHHTRRTLCAPSTPMPLRPRPHRWSR
ncbi:hypothetical protein GCM10011374_34060 [Kocuria dechangensis]|uniref:Major facilitator superfamily (MFS) profile domain-containing protein n=1 Tax=Kocuria dechangensis TaxID=1176249 RepID=A0A917LZJ0_9MICC|nr:MFS transporter [Kocuria dechangensis]GGG67064.1 hypothetical protein GCM10011374_34060 [Kocuria dechangensis]